MRSFRFIFPSKFPVVPVMLPPSHILRQPACRQNSCHKKHDMKTGDIKIELLNWGIRRCRGKSFPSYIAANANR
jgi:hypothetical protein